MVKRFHILLLLVCVSLVLKANDEPLQAQIFSNSIHTIKISPVNNIYFPPIWVMGQDDNPLVFSFDDISEDRKYLRYSIIHCNKDWRPSQLQESEYTNSFNYADIEDIEFSANTFTHYVHYRFSLPNDDIKIFRSGNYIVKVYEQDNPDGVLFQSRFYVCENAVMVTPTVSSRTEIDYNEHHQQLTVTLSDNSKIITDPYNNLQLRVSQNSREDNEVTIDKPLLVSGNKITFDHNRNLIFPAGNEFRRIETVAIHSPSMGVISMQYYEPFYHALLRTDALRCAEPYHYDSTQHGYFTIRNWESGHSDVEADYVVTHFTLDTDGPLSNGDIYIDGEFTGHTFSPSNRLRYDASTGLYTIELLLKQGAYNYQYLWLPKGATVGQTAKIEGDKFQTVNEYLVKAYLRNPGDRYDRLIGFGITFSGK